MKLLKYILILFLLAFISCAKSGEEPVVNPPSQDSVELPAADTVPIVLPDTTYRVVPITGSVSHVQPMTGLVLWPDEAEDCFSEYGEVISLEFSYCLPFKVVTGKQDGIILYDWTWFDNLLASVASRGHQAVVRFRYEYPSGTDVDGNKGTTAVPAYIKALPDYNETYSKNPGGDGPTYYADWSNSELQWFTKQFYTDLAARYGSDNRIAFLEVGFGHWSEYHIYGTKLLLGQNFPSKEYQREFFLHLDSVMTIPWLISIDAADDEYSPFVGDPTLMSLCFGNFDDSFMHKTHEVGTSDGYNEECWNAISQGSRWQYGACGGEISYYSDSDQKNFLNPAGMYGHTWEEQAAKYHISFMIANDALEGKYGTPDRYREAGMASGYRFKLLSAVTNGEETRLTVTNTGIAPIYRDAFFQLNGEKSGISLKGLLPGEVREVVFAQGMTSSCELKIVSDYILPTQQIQFEADIHD